MSETHWELSFNINYFERILRCRTGFDPYNPSSLILARPIQDQFDTLILSYYDKFRAASCCITQPRSFRMLDKNFNEISHQSKINKLICNSEISHLPINNQNHIHNEILCMAFGSLIFILLPKDIFRQG